ETGVGGAGGGAALIVSLGTLDLTDAQLLASGAAGEDGGGGGGGGALLLAGSSVQGAPTLDVTGGEGGPSSAGGDGGAGGRGLVRVDGASELTDLQIGPSFDLSAFSALVSGRSVVLTGRATADVELEIALIGGASLVSTRSDAAGNFRVEVPLTPGLNRLSLSQGSGADGLRSWSGTSVELARLGSALALPVGGALDIVSLPDDE
ncbi:MAG: hypothetical protein GXP55_19935, partial [Deltaproteobacteria bacterium]|nr:hypothetical protein [Deltaproteobacteria bacterium]